MESPETDMGSEAAPPRPKTKKRRLYELHTWLGFHLAFLTVLVVLTGTVAVISNEIDWLVQHDMRVVPDGEKVSWGTMETAVRAAAPGDVLTSLTVGEGDHFAYRATMVRPSGKRYFVHVDQWTGRVTGTTHALTVQRFFRDLHRYLFMPSVLGLPIVCSLAFVLAISLYTGLKTAGRLGTVATRLRINRGTRVMIGDLHKAMGVWSIWFFVLIAVTGVWYLAEFIGALSGEQFEPSRPALTEERIVEIGDVMPVLTADQLVASATRVFPELETEQIFFPQRPGMPATVLGDAGDILVRARANRVFIDPVSGDALKVQRSTDISTVAYLNEIADPLHFGYFGDLPTKIVWFLFGVAMTGLSITGLWLSYRRLKQISVSRAQIATLPIFLATALFGVAYVDSYVGSEGEGPVIATYTDSKSGFNIESTWQAEEDSGGAFLTVTVRHPAGYPVLRSASLTGENGNQQSLRPRTFGNPAVFASVVPHNSINDAGSLTVVVETISGVQLHQKIGGPSAPLR